MYPSFSLGYNKRCGKNETPYRCVAKFEEETHHRIWWGQENSLTEDDLRKIFRINVKRKAYGKEHVFHLAGNSQRKKTQDVP